VQPLPYYSSQKGGILAPSLRLCPSLTQCGASVQIAANAEEAMRALEEFVHRLVVGRALMR
jgi:hypothetical protein